MSQLATLNPAQPAAPDPLLALIERAARDPATDVDKMERLLVMAKDIRATEATAAFNAAMSDAQGEMRPISKDCHNPQTRSKYASYQAVDDATRPIYTKHGFGLRFGAKASTIAEHVIVTCCVSHRAGHCEYEELDMPADGRGLAGKAAMTATHATGSALTYGKRYLAGLIWNLSFGETDDDGNSASPRQAAPQQRQTRTESTEQQEEPKSVMVTRNQKLATVERINGETQQTKKDGSTWMKPWNRLAIACESGAKCGLFLNTDEDKELATRVELFHSRGVLVDLTLIPGRPNKQGDPTFNLVSIAESDDIPM